MDGYTKAAEAAAEPTNGARAARGSREHVSVNMRMVRADWLILRDLAAKKGTTLQGLFLEGMTAVLGKEGLPAMQPVGKWGT